VKKYASVYLREFAFIDFSEEPQRYAAWHLKCRGQTPEEVIRSNDSNVPERIKAGLHESLQDVADIPAQDLLVGGDKQKRYFLIGPREGVAAPKDGYRLLIVMPGGDGGADYHPFVRRIYKHTVNDSFLVAQPVAFKWQPTQQVVWPTRGNPVESQQFAIEDFVEDVVRDVRRQYRLNTRHIFTLAWSSGGPAAYAISLAENKSVTGSYVAMSVFKPDHLPPQKHADGHIYFIDHSPEDRVCPFRMAETAKGSLEDNGATVRLNTYLGGHGWHGDVFDRIRSGIGWLEKETADKPNGD
jgi:predicted esterase